MEIVYQNKLALEKKPTETTVPSQETPNTISAVPDDVTLHEDGEGSEQILIQDSVEQELSVRDDSVNI